VINGFHPVTGDMFMDRDITKYQAPFGGAECSGLVPVYLSSALRTALEVVGPQAINASHP
jgi:hypothetical protein